MKAIPGLVALSLAPFRHHGFICASLDRPLLLWAGMSSSAWDVPRVGEGGGMDGGAAVPSSSEF